jgi:hypothetical protein
VIFSPLPRDPLSFPTSRNIKQTEQFEGLAESTALSRGDPLWRPIRFSDKVQQKQKTTSKKT